MKVALQELANGMNIPATTLDRWIRQGRVPVKRQGPKCVFDQQALEQWARLHRLPLSLASPTPKAASPETKAGGLAQALQLGGVVIGIEGDSVEALLADIACKVAGLLPVDEHVLLSRLKERESLASTGIGKGVAIPHPRSPIENGPPEATIVTCFPKTPVNFDAIDDVPVFVFFVLLCPDTRVHLQMLSRLSYCVRDAAFIDFLKKQPGAKPLVARIAEIEAGME